MPGARSVNKDHPLNVGRQAWWLIRPENYGGGNLFDLIGQRHGKINKPVAGVKWGPATRRGGAGHLAFDGSTGFVTTGNFAPFPRFTISAWAYKLTTGQQTIIAQINATPTISTFHFRINGGSGFSQSGFKQVTVPDISLNTWHHVALTYDANSVLRFYLNGSSAANTSLQVGPPDALASLAVIGRLGDGAVQFWNGYLDGISIWDRALSGSQVADLYQEERAGCSATLPFQKILVVSSTAGSAFAVSASASIILTATASETAQTGAAGTASVILTSTASESRQAVVASVASVVLTATASQVTLFVYQKAASASVILTATASTTNSFHVVASASVILTATALESQAVSGIAGASVVLLVDASALRAIARDAFVRVILRARARIPGQLGPPEGDDYLGRYQQGTIVPLEIQCFQPRGVRGLPDAAPVARMYRDGVLVGAQTLPAEDDLTGRFGGSFPLGRGEEPGLYSVVYWYTTGGTVRSQWQVFEVVSGGDPAGPVIAATVLERPDGDQVLAQFGSGVLAVGRDPYIDEGVR